MISQAAFVKGWTRIVGEPPAALLEDRSAMIEMLVETAAIAPVPWRDEGSTPANLQPGGPDPQASSAPVWPPLRRAG